MGDRIGNEGDMLISSIDIGKREEAAIKLNL